MGNKNKTISFRDIAEERDLSLSAVFRDYVDQLVAHDGRVRIVPEGDFEDTGDEFPPKVEVPKSFVREHERLELEAKHLRAQLEEHKQYISQLQDRLDDESVEDVIHLDDLDSDDDEPFQLG